MRERVWMFYRLDSSEVRLLYETFMVQILGNKVKFNSCDLQTALNGHRNPERNWQEVPCSW